jgi:hypothetical protein
LIGLATASSGFRAASTPRKISTMAIEAVRDVGPDRPARAAGHADRARVHATGTGVRPVWIRPSAIAGTGGLRTPQHGNRRYGTVETEEKRNV